MNKSVYLGLSILEKSKVVIYEFWYDYLKPKYRQKVKLCYMDTDSSGKRSCFAYLLGNKVISKNLYHETFLAYFWHIIKKT